jgi:hypothetical protein
MTRDAVGRSPDKPSSNMTLGTTDRDMSPSEGKFGAAMVKFCSLPLLSRVTNRAVLRETGREVVRVSCRIVSGLMTGNTLGTRAAVLTIRVTLNTASIDMGTRQRELRRGIVIKASPFPLNGVMANRAILRKASGNVIRIGCCIIGCLVTPDALRRRARVLPAHMTLCTTD